MDLRTGRPIWCTLGPRVELPAEPPSRDERCEVAIVGAGVTGALLADGLSGEGRSVVLLDSREPGTGSTAASTSLLLAETDTHTLELEKRIGRGAARVHELGRMAIDALGDLAAGFPGACGFARRPGLYLASTPGDAPLLERELAARRRLGIPCEGLDAAQMRTRGYTFDAPFALLSPAAEIDAYTLTRRLLARAAGRGARLRCPARVTGHERRGGAVALRTEQGPSVHADAVVYASGYEAHEMLDEKLGSLASTWALASEPVDSFEGWPDRALIWETARPYVYIRTTPDNRVVMGGLDEPGAHAHRDEDKLLPKARVLAERFNAMFPRIPLRAATVWAGVFGASHDGLPYIGPTEPGVPVFYALGYGGNGITFSMIAREILAALLRGDAPGDAPLFRFGR